MVDTLKQEIKEKKFALTFIPSKLDTSTKKYTKYKLREDISELKEQQTELQKKIKEEKKQKEKTLKKIDKILRKKITSRKILKPSQMTMTIKKQEPHSVLGEENKFFKNTFEQEKRSMFFD